jgi:hypothetical protein
VSTGSGVEALEDRRKIGGACVRLGDNGPLGAGAGNGPCATNAIEDTVGERRALRSPIASNDF